MTATIATTSNTTGTLKLDTAKSWADVVRAALAAEAKATEADSAPVVETPLPKPLVLSADEQEALEAFATQATNLMVPPNRRMMTVAELTSVTGFLATTKVVAKLVKRATEDTIKPAFHNHFDVKAEKDGVADPRTTPRHPKSGHYLLEDKTSGKVDGLPASAEREVRGGSVSLTVEGLKALEEKGVIDRLTFLSLTSQVRVVDEDKVMAAVRKNPELVEKLRQATSVSDPTIALTIR